MKKIISTLCLFLKQEWITVGVYSIATILFLTMIFHMGAGVDATNQKDFAKHALLMISMLSGFAGVYIGSGFLRLQQSYLWQIHSAYRKTLLLSLILAAFLYGLIQFYPMIYAGWDWQIALIAPACITILTAQLVIGTNLFMKILFPASPFILFQLSRFEIEYDLMFMLLVIICSLAIYLNATNSKKIKTATLGLISVNLEQQNNNPQIKKLNIFFADFFELFNSYLSPKNFAIALIKPANRYGLSSAIIALLCMVLISSMSDGKIEAEAFAALLLGSILLGLFIEIKLLTRQLKSIAHTFSALHFKPLKNKIIMTVQIHIFCQSFIFIILTLLVNLFVSDFVNSLLIIKMGISVALVACIFTPLMLCLNWFNMNFKLIGGVILYLATNLFVSSWQYSHPLSDMLSLSFVYTVIGLILARLASVYLWNRQSVEQFMRVYG